jgi:hypothetical protein
MSTVSPTWTPAAEKAWNWALASGVTISADSPENTSPAARESVRTVLRLRQHVPVALVQRLNGPASSPGGNAGDENDVADLDGREGRARAGRDGSVRFAFTVSVKRNTAQLPRSVGAEARGGAARSR